MPHNICGLLPARLLLFFRFDASPYLPRIPGERGYCLLFMGRRWRGCHNSTTPLRRKKLHIACLRLLAKARSWCWSGLPWQICDLPGLPYAAGFRLKSMDGREQVSLSPMQVNASWLLNQFTRTTLIAHTACPFGPPFTSCRPGGASYSAAAWFSYPQYRIFSCRCTSEGYGKMRPSPYAAETGFW